MKLIVYIRGNARSFVQKWARAEPQCGRGACSASEAGVESFSRMLSGIADYMDAKPAGSDPQLSHVRGSEPMGLGPATEQGLDFQRRGLDLSALVSDFRSLRASLLSHWVNSVGREAVDEAIAFDEGFDVCLLQAVQSHTDATSAARDMFLAILGHDLRAPMSVIAMDNAILRKSDITVEGRMRAVVRSEAAIKEMTKLVSDFLGYARCQVGSSIPVHPAACDLRKVCLSAADAMRAARPDVSIVCELPDSFVAAVDCDRMSEALSNLLQNAAQHGDSSCPITLRGELHVGEASVSIHNFGAPIPARAMEAIFDPLSRFSNVDAKEFGGRAASSVGLGLYIAREIARGHSGELSVESDLESGTVFRLSLPLEVQTERAEPSLDLQGQGDRPKDD